MLVISYDTPVAARRPIPARYVGIFTVSETTKEQQILIGIYIETILM
jgi:hypothetical protein